MFLCEPGSYAAIFISMCIKVLTKARARWYLSSLMFFKHDKFNKKKGMNV